MTVLPDVSARLRTLTDLEITLLVEAAAGTGKTALIAGRVTMLLARGIDHSAIAAITFTELAASSLLARVHRYVRELLAGRMPHTLQLALPDGLSPAQRVALFDAATKLDQLTTSTIHAFCQTLICSYAVEADIDPGAKILDAVQATAAFDDVFDRWLRRRLSDRTHVSDAIGTLSRSDPHQLVATIKALSSFRLKHRDATTLPADWSGRPDIDFVEAVGEFRRWKTGQPAERRTLELIGQLEELATFYGGSFAQAPTFEQLWALAHPPRQACMRRDTFDMLMPRNTGAWERAAGKERGTRLHDEAATHFDRINEAYRTLRGRIATALVAGLSGELDEVLAEYAAFKRSAAVLDFDDLLERARNLLRDHDTVRRALGARYRHVFVDEFQDTDPLQTEILFRLCSEDRVDHWRDAHIRPGALFMVGDPKQAIYRFRGADVASYNEARAAIGRRWPSHILQITANFRSRPAILHYVNRCFESVLNADGQPGYVSLAPTIDPPSPEIPCVATIALDLGPEPNATTIRNAEAQAVAALCSRLIGRLQIRQDDGTTTLLGPGGIALLARTGTDLWRYERALEQHGLPFASQAGKSLLRRQEVQDFVALTRVLADAGDLVAFGSLMRGPLVGLTEEELLDVTAALPSKTGRPRPRFSATTPIEHVSHPVARRVLSILQDLRRRARETTPSLLLDEATERFLVRPILAARERSDSARAAANIEAVIERAKPYGVKGLAAFARDISRDWRRNSSYTEGRVDADGDAIELITIHSAKGLEWPVVIPINTGTILRRRDPLVHRISDNSLHWLIGEVVPPELSGALASDDESQARGRERLWYVACTRARDLLVIPDLSEANQRSWARVVELGIRELPNITLPPRGAAAQQEASAENEQTAERFAEEQTTIAAASVPVTWRRPSDHDEDRALTADAAATPESVEALDTPLPLGAGRIRGLILHKLMEEVLTNETQEDHPRLKRRAELLIRQLAILAVPGEVLPSPEEVAGTVLRTWQLPEVAALRPFLTPEVPIYGTVPDAAKPTAMAARMDALAVRDGAVVTVLDWKSDTAPSQHEIQMHVAQVRDYLQLIGASRGALVYMTSGTVRWVDRAP